MREWVQSLLCRGLFPSVCFYFLLSYRMQPSQASCMRILPAYELRMTFLDRFNDIINDNRLVLFSIVRLIELLNYKLCTEYLI